MLIFIDNEETVVKGLTNDASSGNIAVENKNAKHEPETLVSLSLYTNFQKWIVVAREEK